MSALVRVVARERRDLLGEGPLWSARANALFWVDILARKVQRLSLDDETVASWTLPEMIGWLIERQQAPGFIAGLQSGFAELTLDPPHIVPLMDPEPERPQNRLNDAKADRYGRIWAGSMPVAANEPSGALYRFDPDRKVTRVDGHVDRSIALPASQVTSCTFAGASLERMFVTSAADGAEHEVHAGALFEVDAGVRRLGSAPVRRLVGCEPSARCIFI